MITLWMTRVTEVTKGGRLIEDWVRVGGRGMAAKLFDQNALSG
jgi:hypothetical protein